jgi:hypothetical protein
MMGSASQEMKKNIIQPVKWIIKAKFTHKKVFEKDTR